MFLQYVALKVRLALYIDNVYYSFMAEAAHSSTNRATLPALSLGMSAKREAEALQQQLTGPMQHLSNPGRHKDGAEVRFLLAHGNYAATYY